jgi:hypothetical protein
VSQPRVFAALQSLSRGHDANHQSTNSGGTSRC